MNKVLKYFHYKCQKTTKSLLSGNQFLQGQDHKIKIYITEGNVLPQGIHIYIMKALYLLDQKLWPSYTFSKVDKTSMSR